MSENSRPRRGDRAGAQGYLRAKGDCGKGTEESLEKQKPQKFQSGDGTTLDRGSEAAIMLMLYTVQLGSAFPRVELSDSQVTQMHSDEDECYGLQP